MLSYRKMATKIILDCREHGLKQSVVLNAIAKSLGFRSIQAAEVAVRQDKRSNIALTVMIRTDLYRNYRNSDFLAIDLSTDLQATTLESDDKLFDLLWALALSEPNKVYTTIASCLKAVAGVIAFIEKSEVKNANIESLKSLTCLKDQPQSLVDLIISEFNIASEPDADESMCITASQLEAINKIRYDLDDLLGGFTEANYCHFDLEWF